ncbi:MAG TPA: hypothetical protein VN642_14180, partial [Dongiaceae bacterium]|nr:hypothetical protein [Dongiaceae bacterium]
WAVAIMVTFSLPFGWENALWGFQSQFYLLAAFSMAVLYVACKSDGMDAKWCAALGVLQISALFTMASGLMASIASLCMYMVIFLRNRHDWNEKRMLIVKTVIAVAVIAVGSQLLVHVVSHEQYKAQTFGEFLTVFAHCASWPHYRSDSWWLINWLPWVLLLVMYLFRKTDDRTWIRFALALGFWVILQGVATAYSRNAIALAYSRNSVALSSKYSDPVAIGMTVNVLAMIILFSSSTERYKKFIILLAAIWVTTNSYYLVRMTSDNLTGPLPWRQESYEIQISKTRAFLQSGNISTLARQHKYDIPHRDENQYANLLNDPYIRPILPRSVNEAAVVSDTPHAYLSKAADVVLDFSEQLLFSGVLLMLVMSIFLLIMFFMERIDYDQDSAG